ncbi:MAG TPA: hypothetical protein DEG28_00770 [Porphyromonadaceae bacterium]|nr:hypothetical protein [Porphyromonadaceae bacterium]
MARFINPTYDMAFKRIFGQENSKDLLLDFLNDLLKGEKKIESIRLLDKERPPLYHKGREGIYDIACLTEEEEYIIVEMQNAFQEYFYGRALYYLSQIIANQGEQGAKWEFDVKAVYGIFFLNFELGGKLRTDMILADRDTGEQISDKLRFIFVELPFFTKMKTECITGLDKWIYVLKNMENLKEIPFKEEKPIFKKLEQIADLASLSREERRRYDADLRAYRDHFAQINSAKRLGERIGEKKGRTEGKIEVVRNMKAKGLSVDMIADITGLSPAEIEKIQVQ